jgi:hypothetical protein
MAMGNGPFIDGLPGYRLKMVIFHGYVSHNQMVFRKMLLVHELIGYERSIIQ